MWFPGYCAYPPCPFTCVGSYISLESPDTGLEFRVPGTQAIRLPVFHYSFTVMENLVVLVLAGLSLCLVNPDDLLFVYPGGVVCSHVLFWGGRVTVASLMRC